MTNGVAAAMMRKHFPGVPPKRYPLVINSKPVVDDFRRMSRDERTAWIEMNADVLETSLSMMKIANRIRRSDQRKRRKAAAATRRRRGY